MLRFVMLSGISFTVVYPSVIMLDVIMASVVALVGVMIFFI